MPASSGLGYKTATSFRFELKCVLLGDLSSLKELVQISNKNFQRYSILILRFWIPVVTLFPYVISDQRWSVCFINICIYGTLLEKVSKF